MSNLERVAVLGASGWVGRTVCEWLGELDSQILAVASSNRVEKIGRTQIQLETFDLRRMKDFKPTMVIDAAFITRERLGDFSIQDYVRLNNKLIEQALGAQQLPSVEKFVGVSSGASVPHLNSDSLNLTSDPYGTLKASYESLLLENSELRSKTTIARIWSVSGDLVTKPSIFAFSNLVKQVLSGHVDIYATRRVYRRYVDLKDFIKVSMLSIPGSSRVIDSGGRIIEIEELTNLIFDQLGFHPSISRPAITSTEDDSYYSDNTTWQMAIDAIGFEPLSLEQQILKVAAAFGFKL